MRLIPAIDLKDGRCVRLLRGDFDAETRYDASPQALLAKYHGFGADWLHVVDLDGARGGANRGEENRRDRSGNRGIGNGNRTSSSDSRDNGNCDISNDSRSSSTGNRDISNDSRISSNDNRDISNDSRSSSTGNRDISNDSRSDSTGNRDIIRGLAAQSAVRLQVGGGLRDTQAVSQALDAGVARVVIGSAAVTQMDQVRTWLDDFGPERMVLAFDVRLDETGVPRVAIHGWREQSQTSLWEAVANFADFGLRHVLCTDVSRDGALSGPNIELYAECARRFPHVEWQASGGVRDARDLQALALAGARAAISGKALLDELIPLEELRPFLPNASSPA